jgi:tetratricopeptide (TPR) repeat protein
MSHDTSPHNALLAMSVLQRPHMTAAKRRASPPATCAAPSPNAQPQQAAQGRRRQVLALPLLTTAASLLSPLAARAADDLRTAEFAELEALAKGSYQKRQLSLALDCLSELVRREPDVPVWRERRGQVFVDLKRFEEALTDFDVAERGEQAQNVTSLGLLANRALAYEGLSRWGDAIKDYDRSLQLAESTGFAQPYVLNSRGNCYAALGQWEAALADYRSATKVFRQMKNLSGVVYAESNTALVEAQLGLPEAEQHMQAAARRAAGSIDMRAALASLSWARGDEQKAEELWGFACSEINSGVQAPGGPSLDGCALYRDDAWVRTVRRWPPLMADKLADFVALRHR